MMQIPTNDTRRVVVVGAGQAGSWCATTLKKLQPEREIIVIGREPYAPYERPPLSKSILLGTGSLADAYIKPYEYYVEAGIDLRLSQSVEKINRNIKTLSLSDGSQLEYGVLVIATGMRPKAMRTEGADHPKICSLREINDIPQIQKYFYRGAEILIIGAGFIGLEVAAAARNADAVVTVIETEETALSRIVAHEVGNAIVRRHEKNGVAFRFSETITKFQDNRDNLKVCFENNEEKIVDLVVVGIGGVPNEEIAKATGLECNNGIIVNEFSCTSDPDIFAIGDVCKQFDPVLGRLVRLESWQNAQNGGIALGKYLAGLNGIAREVPWFWTDQYDDNFQIVGLPEFWDEVLWRGNPESQSFTVIYMKDGRVVGGNALNSPRDIRPLKNLIQSQTSISPPILLDTSMPLSKITKTVLTT